MPTEMRVISVRDAAGLNDVFEFFEMKPASQGRALSRKIRVPITTGVEFRNVSFGYAGTSKLALDMSPSQSASERPWHSLARMEQVNRLC
jgi:ABC-type multidrug transport system fused ATPase/permease subunit